MIKAIVKYNVFCGIVYSFGDADTSEMDGGGAMPSVSESLPLLTINANGNAILTTNLLQGDLGCIVLFGSWASDVKLMTLENSCAPPNLILTTYYIPPSGI